MLIKYNAERECEWAKVVGGSENDYIKFVIEMKDGGYIIGGNFYSSKIHLEKGITLENQSSNTSCSDVMIVKYSSEGEIEWAKGIGGSATDQVTSLVKAQDGGYIVGGYFESAKIRLGLINQGTAYSSSDGMLIKYNDEKMEWAKGIGGTGSDRIISVTETDDKEIVVGGNFSSSEIHLENGKTLTSNGSYDGMLLKVRPEMGVPEIQELEIENQIKQFKITTDVKEIDGIKGGTISGEDKSPYEKVKYNQNNTQEIIMKPDENYEIIGITVNGKEYPFEANEDGTYTMPQFEQITEDKHIEVTYSLKDNKIIINKVDSKTRQPLEGANFKLDQIEERTNPENVVGGLTANGQQYIIANPEDEVTGTVGELTESVVDLPHFVEQEGAYVPTNSKTYQKANVAEATGGIQNSTANSYVPINLTGKEGQYVVVINARASSESNYDIGYATITENTNTPTFNKSNTYDVKISGTVAAKDYTSTVLQGGKVYYLHLAYQKDGSGDTNEDQVVFNSIKVYEATTINTESEITEAKGELTQHDIQAPVFVQKDGTYVPTNSKTYQMANVEGATGGIQSSTANSYIPIDLTGRAGKYVVVVNASVSSQSGNDYGYAVITENTNIPSSSASKMLNISGTVAAKDYNSSLLEGGKMYYLHLGYQKNASTDTGDDQIVFNSIKVVGTTSTTYNFIENEGKYESNNQGKDSTVANSYLPIDLTGYTGKYNLVVNAKVSSENTDYGYATVTENTTRPSYSTTTGRFIYISGTTGTNTEDKDYTTVLQGGKIYYLHLGYYKNGSTSSGDDKFTVNSVKITLNDSELYHTEVTTNSQGQAITQIPFGKYNITEIKAPEGYELNEEPQEVEFRADQNHEFTIENSEKAKLVVHHYIKGTTQKVAEDSYQEGKIGQNYKTEPQLDLAKYELEKDEEQNLILPENALGTYVSGTTEVTYYYVEKQIPLTVHHYIEGTTTPVPLADGTEAKTVQEKGNRGQNYQTNEIEDSLLSEHYELVEVPENAQGTYEENEITVIYYYKKVEKEITITKVDAQNQETPLAEAEFTITPKKEKPKPIVSQMQANGNYQFEKQGEKYVSTNQNKNSTSTNGYIEIDLTKVGKTKIKVNAEVGSESNFDIGYATVTEDTNVPNFNKNNSYFIKISGTQAEKDYETELEGGKVYYLHFAYVKDGSSSTAPDTFTINSIEVEGAVTIPEIYTTNDQGKITTTLEVGEYVATEITAPQGYELPENPQAEFVINKETDKIELTIPNHKKQGNVVVHHYIQGTEEKVPAKEEGQVVEDETKTGNLGDIFITKESENVNESYELVQVVGNESGEYEEEEQVVIYYYKLKAPEITNHEITKTSNTEKVTDPSQSIDYTINYQATINPYIGTATITMVDNLPYEIDQEKSNLADGIYDAENRTITWEETIENINTVTEGSKTIEITKQISLVFTNLDVTQETVINNVAGTLKLESPEKEETVESTKEIPAEYLINIVVNKIWNDNEVQKQRRPKSIVIQVKNGEEVVASKEVNTTNAVEGKENQWAVEFENLPKYGEDGNEIVYTVDETVLDGDEHKDDLKFYTKEITKVEDNQATIRNTFTVPDEKTEIIVNKIWKDNNNENGRRPEAIKLQVKNGKDIVKEEVIRDTWVHTFTDLPKYNENGEEIVYTVDETVLDGDEHKEDLKFYTKSIQGTTITNTFTVPDERIKVTVNKVWKDNDIQKLRRPEKVVVVLKQGNQEVARQEIGQEENWTYTFENLPKYNEKGQEIEYAVDETVLDGDEHKEDLKFYTKQIGKVTENKQATIINTFQKPEDTTNVVVNKIWNDNNNEAEKRPESIKLQLKQGNNQIVEEIVTVENAIEDNTNTWEYTFENLPKYNENGQEIGYTVDEVEVNSEDLKFYEKTIEGTTITNTFTQNTDKINVTATKVWEDNEVQKARRPSSVVIQLKRNGEVVQSKDLAINQEQNEFSLTFEDLPKYDQYNNIISYTVDEDTKDVGDLKFYVKTIDGNTITNTFVRPIDMISIQVEKQWVDQTNIYEKRPETVTIEVKNGEKLVQAKVISSEENWETTFTKLPKYDENGQEISYTIKEKETNEGELSYYTSEVGRMEEKGADEKQVIVTNTMTKIPGFVEIKYVDKNTKDEIDNRGEEEGIVGDNFDISNHKKEIPGYTLVEEPEEITGTYTEKTQIKTYYYAKNTKVIVKYLEQGTNKILTPEPQYEILGYEGQGYTTTNKQIEDYTFIESTKNTSGTMKRDEIEVIYYYAPNTKVHIRHLEKDDTPENNTDNKVLASAQVINGYVGQEYETKAVDIDGYTLIENTNNTKGTMTKDEIEVIYYYAKNTKVIVKYLEQDNTPDNNLDNNVLATEEELNGYVGQNYETNKKEIEDYIFVESTNNTKGTMEKDVIEVIYYYAQKTKATVQHIDKETGKILKQESKAGKVGDIFKTHPEDIEGYVVVIVPENPDVTMTKEEQIVKYYYVKISAGVVEKHIDIITGELLDGKQHQGNKGDDYKIDPEEFQGYELVIVDKDGNDRLPNNAEGKMEEELIEVKYYYIKKASLRVKHIDQETGLELAEDETTQGYENDDYETKEKTFKGYELVETPKNANGKLQVTKNEDGTYNTETVVTYYYQKPKAKTAVVLEKHIDINTGKTLAKEEHKGKVGDSYSISSKDFTGYELVSSKLPTNYKGQMTEEEIEVIYYYQKIAKVTVQYIDKQTGEKLNQDEIKGYVGQTYETEEKQFDGYELIEVPSNGKGEMKDSEIVVKYYYKKKAEIEIQYLEKDNNYPLAESEVVKGYVGDKYETQRKDIPYYKFVESTTNTKGTMTADKITVIYYYQKQIFNLSVDKWVSKVSLNGITTGARDYETKDQLYKLDIHRNKVANADLKVTYTIRISNKGEIEGTVGKITELIPAGFSFHQEDNDLYWEEAGGILITESLKDQKIQADEIKEIQLVLRWNPSEENFGSKNNSVIIGNLNNPAGYQDIDKEDNQAKSEMLLTIATGLDRNDRIVIIGIVQIVLAISVGLLVSYKKKEK